MPSFNHSVIPGSAVDSEDARMNTKSESTVGNDVSDVNLKMESLGI